MFLRLYKSLMYIKNKVSRVSYFHLVLSQRQYGSPEPFLCYPGHRAMGFVTWSQPATRRKTGSFSKIVKKHWHLFNPN